MGIGTLIIFIAMVLVAAVAAAVLIQTSGILQQKAQQTGKEATEEVSSNLKIISVIGERVNANSATPVGTLNVTVELSAGGSDIDFQQVIVKYINETSTRTFTHNASSATASNFQYMEERDPEGTPNVLSAGDLGVITINLTASTQELIVRRSGTVHIIPEAGVMVIKDVKAPTTYGTKTRVQLFP